MPKNRQFLLAARPQGMPKESDFKLVKTPVPTPKAGEILIQAQYLSVDPYMRGRMTEGPSYAECVKLGEVMTGSVVGAVLDSRNPTFKPGDIVEAWTGWQEYSLSNGEGVRKIDPSLAPISTALGVLGMPGVTAYFGLIDICQPQAGETLVVSAAAGAVGSLVGQIGKIRGCRVIGTAGSHEKVRYVEDDLGFDAAFNYKTEKNYSAKLRELCPRGIDMYFDNVGGSITDAVFPLINRLARISVCGQISIYNQDHPDTGPRPYVHVLIREAKIQGFIVTSYLPRWGEGLTQMAQWLKAGKLKYREDIVEGFEKMPQAFIGMLQGKNIGKQLVKV